MQGEQLAEKLVVPRLRVHKDWFVGLAEDFIDHSHPDVGAAPDSGFPLDAQVDFWSTEYRMVHEKRDILRALD